MGGEASTGLHDSRKAGNGKDKKCDANPAKLGEEETIAMAAQYCIQQKVSAWQTKAVADSVKSVTLSREQLVTLFNKINLKESYGYWPNQQEAHIQEISCGCAHARDLVCAHTRDLLYVLCAHARDLLRVHTHKRAHVCAHTHKSSLACAHTRTRDLLCVCVHIQAQEISRVCTLKRSPQLSARNTFLEHSWVTFGSLLDHFGITFG